MEDNQNKKLPELLRVELARRERLHLPRSSHPQRAAVAVVLTERADELHVAMIKRADHPDDPWSGQMGFPGGREDPDDQDAWATASREAREEVALELERAERLGCLPDVQALSAGRPLPMAITPVVFHLPDLQPMRPHMAEVAEAIWVPLRALRDPSRRVQIERTFDGHTYYLPGVDYEGRVVWGLTYRMLNSLFMVLDQADEGQG